MSTSVHQQMLPTNFYTGHSKIYTKRSCNSWTRLCKWYAKQGKVSGAQISSPYWNVQQTKCWIGLTKYMTILVMLWNVKAACTINFKARIITSRKNTSFQDKDKWLQWFCPIFNIHLLLWTVKVSLYRLTMANHMK